MKPVGLKHLTFGGLLLAALCAASLGVAGAGGASPVPSSNYMTDQAANHEAADLAQALTPVISADPGFASVRISSAGLEIATVGSPSPTLVSAVNAAVAAASTPVQVNYRQVQNSNLVLTRASASISADRATWADRGVHISSVGLSAETNTVAVTLSDYSASSAALLSAAFPGVVTVKQTSQSFSVSSGRTADSAPWYGGDSIYVGGNGQCTSYFSLHSTGNNADYNATAAHCGLGNVVNGNATQGTAISGRRHWSDGGSSDVVVYPVASNGPYIWGNPNAYTRAVTMRATSDPEGTLLCTGGAADNEVCSVAIRTSPFSFQETPSIYLYNQVYCEQVNGAAAFSGGDSGGPIYAGRNGAAEAQAFGMIIAHGKNASGADLNWTGVYTPVRYVFSGYSDLTFQPYVS